MDYTITRVKPEEVKAPDILYKFRNWTDNYHKTILTEQIVYMAPPSSFEDEKEFRNFKRYDLMTDSQVFDKYMEISKVYHKQYTRVEHRAYARAMVKKAPFKNPIALRDWQERSCNEYDNRIGVLSLTAHNAELAIWNKHANEGQGFGVGFDRRILFGIMNSGGEVCYPDNGLPLIHGTDSFELQRWKQAFNKELKWKFEKEYRVDIFRTTELTMAQRLVKLPKECFKEIVFGWAIDASSRNTIIQVCEDQDLSVTYYQSSLLNDSVIINRISI